jgi:hypothetical protein
VTSYSRFAGTSRNITNRITTFTSFSRLPNKIREQIWLTTVPPPVVKLYALWTSGARSRLQFHLSALGVRKYADILLYQPIAQEARAVALCTFPRVTPSSSVPSWTASTLRATSTKSCKTRDFDGKPLAVNDRPDSGGGKPRRVPAGPAFDAQLDALVSVTLCRDWARWVTAAGGRCLFGT